MGDQDLELIEISNFNFVSSSDCLGSLKFIGTAAQLKPYDKPPKQLSEPSLELMKCVPELQGWQFPPRGPSAELSSLRVHSELINANRSRPEAFIIENAINKAVSQYKSAPVPKYFLGSDVQISIEDLDDIMLCCVNQQGGPGFPLGMRYTNKRDCWLAERLTLFPIIKRRLVAHAQGSCLNLLPEDIIKSSYYDCVRVFVKNEFHKPDKVKQGRFRLIASCSLIDELVGRVIFSNQDTMDKLNYLTQPSKAGLGFTDKQVLDFLENLPNFDEMVSSDVSFWDWSVTDWLFQADAEARIRISDPKEVHKLWCNAVRSYAYAESHKVFVTSDGKLYSQMIAGIVPSGSVITSSRNSRMRVILSYIVGSKTCVANGDDALEDFVADAQSIYAKYGFKVKVYDKVIDNKFEFSGHIYDTHSKFCYAQNTAKIMINLCQQTTIAGYYRQFLDNINHHPDADNLISIIKRVWLEHAKLNQKTLKQDEEDSEY